MSANALPTAFLAELPLVVLPVLAEAPALLAVEPTRLAQAASSLVFANAGAIAVLALVLLAAVVANSLSPAHLASSLPLAVDAEDAFFFPFAHRGAVQHDRPTPRLVRENADGVHRYKTAIYTAEYLFPLCCAGRRCAIAGRENHAKHACGAALRAGKGAKGRALRAQSTVKFDRFFILYEDGPLQTKRRMEPLQIICFSFHDPRFKLSETGLLTDC